LSFKFKLSMNTLNKVFISNALSFVLYLPINLNLNAIGYLK